MKHLTPEATLLSVRFGLLNRTAFRRPLRKYQLLSPLKIFCRSTKALGADQWSNIPLLAHTLIQVSQVEGFLCRLHEWGVQKIASPTALTLDISIKALGSLFRKSYFSNMSSDLFYTILVLFCELLTGPISCFFNCFLIGINWITDQCCWVNPSV